jgi:hypothetical protein
MEYGRIFYPKKWGSICSGTKGSIYFGTEGSITIGKKGSISSAFPYKGQKMAEGVFYVKINCLGNGKNLNQNLILHLLN